MKKTIYIIAAIIISISACTEDFDVDLDSTYIRTVIQGSISDEYKRHKIEITKTADYFDNTPAPNVTGATVTISDGENIFNLTETSEGIYETDSMAGEVGKTYTLNIDAEGMQYSASSYLNYCPPMDSIKFGYYEYTDSYQPEDTTLAILMYALEPETPDNFYLWNVYKNGILDSDTLHEKVLYDDVFVNGNYMYALEVQWLEANYGDTITLEIQSVTEEYSEYFFQILQETVWNMGPLDGPPANPKGNIFEVNPNDNDNDNPLGFFLAYSIDTITEIVPASEELVKIEWY